MLKIPKVGEFYWHMKHEEGDLFSYLYIIIGLSLDTEEDNLEVIYAPLYDTDYELFNRDLNIFMGTKTIDGKEVPRFTQVVDTKKLEQIYDSGRIAKWKSILSR